MKIATITYRRVKNLGDYQSESFEASATINEGEEADIVADELKNFVLKRLGLYRHQPATITDDIQVEF